MTLKTETRIVLLILFISAAILSPPDVVSQLTMAIPMLIIYVILRIFVSRFKLIEQTSRNINMSTIVLICLLSIIVSYIILALLRVIIDCESLIVS